MKKVLFSLFVSSVLALGVQAQSSSCAKSCAAKPAGATCSSKSADANAAAAAKLASMDATIETRTTADNGAVCYVRKETDKKGNVSYTDVNYDAATNTFVNVSPSKTSGASCGPKNTSASGKSCAAGSSTSGCCAGKSKTASTTTTTSTTSTTAAKTVTPTKG